MAAVQGEGRIVHLKGQVSLDETGSVVGAGSMLAQVERTLENIQLVLGNFGGRMSDVYSLTNHVTNIDAFMKSGDVREKYFHPPFPVTTTVEVSRLHHSDLMVEITASAEISVERFRTPAR